MTREDIIKKDKEEFNHVFKRETKINFDCERNKIIQILIDDSDWFDNTERIKFYGLNNESRKYIVEKICSILNFYPDGTNMKNVKNKIVDFFKLI
jgi:hypothetical protein